MLHDTAVSIAVREVLAEISRPLAEVGFSLAGGTSLALRRGHRLSVDLDFFTTDAFDSDAMARLPQALGGEVSDRGPGMLQWLIKGVKVELLRHDYPLLSGPETLRGIRMWSLADVGAMKLNAITNRGSKKDFFDLHELLRDDPLTVWLERYCAKYSVANSFMVIRSLAWFEDAESEPDPVVFGSTTWSDVKRAVGHAISGLS